MKKVFFILLLVVSFASRATVLDSLLQVAIDEKDPKLKSDYYLSYVYQLSRISRDSSIVLCERYEDSCGTHFDYGKYRAQSLRSFFICFEARYEESLRLLHDALAKQKAIKDESGIAQTLNRLGLTNNQFGRFDEAMRYYQLALNDFTRLKDTTRMDMVLNNLGALKATAMQNMEAIQYYRQSLAIRLHRKDFFWVAYTYYNIGQAYLNNHQLDSAQYYLELAVQTFHTRTETGKTPAMVDLGLGLLYYETNQYEQAYTETQKALDKIKITGQTELLLEGKPLLSKILFAQGQYKKAYEVQQEFLDLKSSIDSINSAEAVAEIESKYRNAEQALEIEKLTTQKLDVENKAQKLELYAILIAALLILFIAFIWFQWARRNQHEKMERYLLNSKIAEARMFALRAQMNPHFIFNCINTAQHFVMTNEQQRAYEYLSDFAKLLRLVMENAAKTFIPFEDELEQIRLYLELEAIRFNHKFNYTIKQDAALGNGIYEIPGMLIQPLIENAIGHGLINRNDENGILIIAFKLSDETIICEVTDNGVGRKRAQEIKQSKQTHYASAAIPNIRERLTVLQQEAGVDVSLVIQDLESNGEPAGTRAVLTIPYR